MRHSAYPQTYWKAQMLSSEPVPSYEIVLQIEIVMMMTVSFR